MRNATKRIGSFVIDLSIVGMFYQMVTFVTTGYFFYTLTNLAYDTFVFITYILLYVTVAVVYQLVCYKVAKGSLGKLLMQVKVVVKKGKRPTVNQMFKRELTKYYLLMCTLGVYGIWQLYVLFNKKENSFHDQFAQTTVD